MVHSVEHISTRVVKVEVQASASSKDLQVVETKLAVNIRLTPSKVPLIFRNVGNLDDVTLNIVRPAVQESLKKNTAQFTAEELIHLREKLRLAVSSDIEKNSEEEFYFCN